MKTKILGGIALLAIAAAMAFNVSLNTDKNNQMSALALANVEALASESASNTGKFCVNKPRAGGIFPARNCGATDCGWFLFCSGYDSTGKCS